MSVKPLLEAVACAIRDARALPGTNPVARLSDVDRRAAQAAIAIVLQRAAQACLDQQKVFLSPEYAVGQPLSSFHERFACGRCAEEILTLGDPA